MPNLRPVPLLIALFLPSSLTVADEQARYPLLAVEDGDTLIIEVEGEEKRLQLTGIDAPEDVMNPKLQKDLQRTGLTQHTLVTLGQKATQHLKTLVPSGTPITIQGDLNHRDKYGRIPVTVYREDSSINEAMVRDGYAVVLRRAQMAQPLREKLQQQQQNAIDNKLGLWGTQYKSMRLWSGL